MYIITGLYLYLGASGYGEWTQWTLCTQTCGSSVQIRTRQCNVGVDPSQCSDPPNQTKPCDKGPCPGVYISVLTKTWSDN